MRACGAVTVGASLPCGTNLNLIDQEVTEDGANGLVFLAFGCALVLDERYMYSQVLCG